MSRQHRQDVTPGFGWLGLWSGVLLCSTLYAVVALAETATPRPPAEPHALQAQPQERFLQHFMTQSLSKEAPQTAPTLPPAPTSGPSAGAPVAPGLLTAPPQVNLTTTTLKMVLALGGMLGLLMLVGYGIRRYFLEQSPLGKRQGALRVIGRVSLTPKASVALLEVPGKVLVVGITGTNLTALGEVPLPAVAPAAPPAADTTPPAADTAAPVLPNTPAMSFATALDEQTLGTVPAQHDMLVRVSEAIQQKVSRLKQL